MTCHKCGGEHTTAKCPDEVIYFQLENSIDGYLEEIEKLREEIETLKAALNYTECEMQARNMQVSNPPIRRQDRAEEFAEQMEEVK